MEVRLTKKQLAERWQCSTRTIERLLDNKRDLDKLVAVHVNGLIRFRIEDVERFEATHLKHTYFGLAQGDSVNVVTSKTDADSITEHDPKKLAGLRDWLDIQNLP